MDCRRVRVVEKFHRILGRLSDAREGKNAPWQCQNLPLHPMRRAVLAVGLALFAIISRADTGYAQQLP